MENQLRLLSEKEVCAIIGYGRVSLWKLCKEDMFPAPVLTPLRAKRWRSTDVEAWIKNLPTVNEVIE